MKKTMLITLILIFTCVACSSVETNNEVKPNTVGSDRDKYGCIASAGYQWCDSTKQCERPWELAKKEGFNNNKESFAKFCDDKGKKSKNR